MNQDPLVVGTQTNVDLNAGASPAEPEQESLRRSLLFWNLQGAGVTSDIANQKMDYLMQWSRDCLVVGLCELHCNHDSFVHKYGRLLLGENPDWAFFSTKVLADGREWIGVARLLHSSWTKQFDSAEPLEIVARQAMALMLQMGETKRAMVLIHNATMRAEDIALVGRSLSSLTTRGFTVDIIGDFNVRTPGTSLHLRSVQKAGGC